MPLEVFSFIPQLVATNPLGTDPKSQGDDHLRGIKATLQNQFPNFVGVPMTKTEAELNATEPGVLPFTDYLLGYGTTGGHTEFTGDLDIILGNSVYYIEFGSVTNEPPDFLEDGFILTNRHPLHNNTVAQTLWGTIGNARWKVWMRFRQAAVWGDWKLASNTRSSILAWVKFNGTTGAIIADEGVASIAKNGTGDYTLTLNIALLAVNNTVVNGLCGSSGNVMGGLVTGLTTIDITSKLSTTGAPNDDSTMNVTIIGEQ